MTDRLEPLWIDWNDRGVTYAVAPKVCRRRDCATRLSAYNPNETCWSHTERTFVTGHVLRKETA